MVLQKKPETRPYTNFSVFHDLLMSRLKTLNQLANTFEARSKEIETRYSDKLSEIRRQFESRWRKVEKIEASVKSFSDNRASWKQKFALKEGELDALKSTCMGAKPALTMRTLWPSYPGASTAARWTRATSMSTWRSRGRQACLGWTSVSSSRCWGARRRARARVGWAWVGRWRGPVGTWTRRWA